MTRKPNLVEAYFGELILVPLYSRDVAAHRGDLLTAAKNAHGQFYANCLNVDARPAVGGEIIATPEQLAAFFDGAHPSVFNSQVTV